MNDKKTYWRVEKWLLREDDNGEVYEEFRRQTTFDSLEEAQNYFDKVSEIYRVKLYKVDDLLLSSREPIEELDNGEEFDEEKFLNKLKIGKLPNCT